MRIDLDYYAVHVEGKGWVSISYSYPNGRQDRDARVRNVHYEPELTGELYMTYAGKTAEAARVYADELGGTVHKIALLVEEVPPSE